MVAQEIRQDAQAVRYPHRYVGIRPRNERIGRPLRAYARIGAVDEELLDRAWKVAHKLASGSPTAVRWTKYALNNWLRAMGPTFDTSLALEFLGFTGPDVREGLSSLREKREPRFEEDAPI